MKRRIILVCLFYCVFRLPIYESIAAIFWQSASYVYAIFRLTDFSSDAFDFSSSKTEWALSAIRAFQPCFSSNPLHHLLFFISPRCQGTSSRVS